MATPSTHNIEIYRGDDFEAIFQILTCDVVSPSTYPSGLITEPTVIDGATFTPLDLTGSTMLSQIRKTTATNEPLIIPFTVTIIDALHGKYSLSLTNAQTNDISNSGVVSYRYDTQVITAANKVRTYVVGAVTIALDVSRAV